MKDTTEVEALMGRVALSKTGYAGILGDGSIVDRRKFPNAVPVQKNPMMGIPAPKKVSVKNVPKHQDKTFNSKEEFEDWLEANTKFEVEFVDRGQDLLKIHLDNYGEVLHCNLQASVWNGLIAIVKRLKPGKPIIFYKEDEPTVYWNLIVEKVTVHEVIE